MKLVFAIVLCLIALSFAQSDNDEDLRFFDENGNEVHPDSLSDEDFYGALDNHFDADGGDGDDDLRFFDEDGNEVHPDSLSDEDYYGALDNHFDGGDEGYWLQAPGYVQSKFGGRQSVNQYLRPSRTQERATLNSRPMQFESLPSAHYGYGTNFIGTRQISNAARFGGRF